MSFRHYEPLVAALPGVDLTQRHLLRRGFLIGREDQLSVYYAPIDPINTKAKVVLVGLCPGWKQMQLAFTACRNALQAGDSGRRACIEAKNTGQFAGMRGRISKWLDQLGVNDWLGLDSTDALFEDRRDLLHATSAIRYPVFVGPNRRNYTGYGPRPEKSGMLMQIVHARLVPELKKVPGALVVPFGNIVSRLVEDVSGTDPALALFGFPHPSGLNGHGPSQFKRERRQMRRKVETLPSPRWQR